MYPLMLSLVAALAFAGTGFAQTRHSAPKAPTVLRDTSAASPAKKTVARPVGQKASIAHSSTRPSAKPSTQHPVPAGRYAREALTNLGVWDDVSTRLVRADSVRSALAFVSRGEAALGIVYVTDALIDKNVRVVDAFPESMPVSVMPLTVTVLPVAAFLSLNVAVPLSVNTSPLTRLSDKVTVAVVLPS